MPVLFLTTSPILAHPMGIVVCSLFCCHEFSLPLVPSSLAHLVDLACPNVSVVLTLNAVSISSFQGDGLHWLTLWSEAVTPWP
ncbi:hypothetical protein K438DRAFT_1049571 [Mycena galopus ATCC 62051]|nr:hypothetical protein K438DRAFT_1049571 [Mycena galopus ATCC 62051]